jgi:dTDP-4-amino-4,6-dideoxygalactose transaminase
MSDLPFLRPLLVTADEIVPYLRRIDESRLYSNFGPLVGEFEQKILTEYFQSRGAVTTVHNATLGLMLAIDAVRRPGGRYAVMPSFTFAATPQAALWCGLQPYFVDVRPNDFCLDEGEVKAAVETLGEDVAVVVPYAAFGTVCDLAPYRQLIEDGIPVVVDAAASFGARLDDVHFGQDFAGPVVYSFHATKSFGIGEGGLVYSGRPGVIEQVRKASNFSFSAQRVSEGRGLNAKLPEYSAAIGLATLERYPLKVSKRQELHGQYVATMERAGLLLKGWGLQTTTGAIAHQFMGVVCPQRITNSQAVAHLHEHGIQARTYFSPACHEQPMFCGMPRSDLSQTEMLGRHILNLPLWEDLPPAAIDRVVRALSLI